jgi:hypothetical protein
MRYFFLWFAVPAVPGLAFSQATVVPGHATNYAVAPGAYAAPFVARVVTPEAAFPNPRLEVGARNATDGNLAGASSATPTQPFPVNRGDLVPPAVSIPPSLETQVEMPLTEATAPPEMFNPGASLPQDAFGLAQLANGRPPNRPSVRKFTNNDLPQLNDSAPR